MKKIKTALLSYGMSGKIFHAPFLELHPGFELKGSWERTNKLIQQDYPEVKSYSSLEELLAEDIDLVVINTPVNTHYELAKKALMAGKHALVEKAFTATVAEAEELLAIAREKNLKLCVYQNRRWDSDFKTVRQVIDQGLLGDIVEAEFHFDRYNPLLSPKAHKENAGIGAGILIDLGPHIIDQALQLFGMPSAVFGDLRVTRDNSQVQDWFDILLYYPDKRVRLKAGYFVREAVPAYIIHGKKGSFLKQRGDVQEDVMKIGQKPNLDTWGTEAAGFEGVLHTEIDGLIIKRNVPTHQGNYYGLFDELHKSITEDKPEPVPAEDGVKIMRIIEAAIESSRQEKVIDLK